MIGPADVSADLSGFSYVIDSGHESVARFHSTGQGLGEFVQRVDIDGAPLVHPIAVTADDDRVYVADQSGVIAIFQRHK